MDWLLPIVLALLVALGGTMFYIVRLLRKPKEERPDQAALLLGQRLEALTQQVNQQLEQSRQASERSAGSVTSQVQSFTKGMTELQEEVRRVQEQVKHVVSFQDIFRSPKLRGNWGEYSLESALSQYFAGASWHMQHQFTSGEAVDAVLQLPNGTLLPIDSKFNWENFQKMVQADNDIATEGYRKQFLSDVKKRIDEIAAKYLLPGEGTTDFALMYVPAETVYYEIINNIAEADVADYARKKKVVLCSPNTFYLTVTAVQHWFRDAQFSKQTQDIMKRLGAVIKDAGKLSDDFRVLGKHLSNAKGAYEDSEKRLNFLVERTEKVIEMGEEQKKIES
jgi:DNA recombination protein RmuC